MRRLRQVVVGTAAFMMISAAIGCSDNGGGGYSSSPSPTSPSATATTSAPAGAPAEVKTASAGDLGTVLVDKDGRTLYLFEADKSTKSTCNGACATAWPPLLTSGKPSSSGSAKSALLGMSKRDDGKTQVTYHGHPVYLYAGDSKPGDTNGEALEQFGAEWYVLDADGNKVDKS
ncbi:hypothetical protein SRB5_09680 [Streptomyces sp. RB5]|uniref:Lipoprotein n=1 Tax=Streptomyces smaragdinus TaxID=2585196 RepID=A0A7K0CBN4_9ACTN|nr:hypothetical protein [Streptomyces smaragdinus]MQY10855.1 hypothetical protein [Streptomyces smaragdinus]